LGIVRGSYTETAWSAVAGRLAFAGALGAVVFAEFFHTHRLFASPHVAHFAGFYLLGFASAAAAKRIPLLTLGCFIAAFAVLLELVRAAIWLPLNTSYLDWVGDMAGIIAALAPMLLQKIRDTFLKAPEA
jgi:hypothetical protein